MNTNVMIRDLPKEELPRERLINYGAKYLTNEELLCIILRTGTHNISVKDISKNILVKLNDIGDLKNVTINSLETIKGLKTVKAVTLLAAVELGRRVYEKNKVQSKMKINNSFDVFKYFSRYIIDELQENLLVIYLDNQKQYIKHKILFKGTINQSVVHPREIFKEAYLESASSIIIMHNHPSGILTPSHADDEFTRQIVTVGGIMGIDVLDHLIVGNRNYYSYVESGRLRYEKK